MVGGSQRGTQKNWARKVKTGCLTCKKRRIKCDEAKPACKKCITHDVVCEGYPDVSELPAVGRYAATATSSGWEVITPETMSMGSTRRSAGVTDWETNSVSRGSMDASLPIASAPGEKGNDQDHDRDRDRDRDDSNRSNNSVARYYTPASINAWTESFSPYTTTEQRLAMNVWLDLAPSLGRSQQGLTYWSVSLPTIAWGHSSVRNAMTATSIVFHSLRQKESPGDYAIARTTALRYANQCIRELVVTKAPPEAMIACSSLFFTFEMLLGNWTSSMIHMAAGTKIAKYTRLSTLSDPLVAQYIRSFIGGLPDSINPVTIMGMSKEDRETQSDLRHRYAKFIMRDALDRLEVYQVRLNAMHSPRKDRAIQMISRTARELDRIYQQWPVSMAVDDEPAVIHQAIKDHSPFIQVIQDAEVFFHDHDIKHITEFETWFRPCIDYFIWLAACFHLRHRQHMVEVWNVKRQILPLTNRRLPTTEVEET